MTDQGLSGGDARNDHELVPAWLALLILVLIVAVVGVAGFIIRGKITRTGPVTTVEADIREWKRAVQADPADTDAHLNLAYAYQQDQEFDEALQEYGRVLRDRPKDVRALVNSGVIYMQTKQPKKAEAAYWAALDADPVNMVAAKELGTYYASVGHYRSLIRAVRPVVEKKPEFADLQYLMGLGYEKLGRNAWAAERYRLAIRYEPAMADAHAGLERIEAKRK